MSDECEYINKCRFIIDYMDTRDIDFDTSFVESVLNFMMTTDRITERQAEAIDNIIEKWNIPYG
jgi:hypothetical protein